MADVAAIVLRLAGAPLAKDMDGQVPRGLVEEPESWPRVSSYEDWFPRGAAPAAAPGSAGELLERLRSLGYVQ